MSCEIQLIFDEARTALERLKRGNTFKDWQIVGTALVVIQTSAMAAVHTNKPAGRRYCTEVGAILKEQGLDEIDKGTRSRLLDVMKNRPAIEAWLATLETPKRLKMNHPTTVLSAWKRATVPPKEEELKPKPELCGILKSYTTEERRVALDDLGFALLFKALSPGMRAQFEQRLANPHAINRLAEKNAKEEQTVEAAKKEADERAPKLGNVTDYNNEPKAKHTKAPTAKPKNIGLWRKFSHEKLQAAYDQERRRMTTEHLNVRELKRLEEMRERLAAFEKTDTAVARQGDGGDPVAEAQQRMADNGKRFAEAPEATAA